MKTAKRQTTKNKEPLNIFLVGDIGSGKGTQGKLLKKKFKLYDIDMGVEQEHQRKANKKLDAIFKKTVDVGKMNPTGIYRKLVTSAIVRTPRTRGILFAGHPKMPSEVRFVNKLLAKVGRTRVISIYLSVPWEETVERNLKRKGYFGNKRRADDSLVAIMKRKHFSQAYLLKSKPLYMSLYPFAQVSGLGTILEVHKRVMRAIERLQKQV